MCFLIYVLNILDPIFPLHFLAKSWVPRMFESMFRAIFLAAILLFWLCAFHGIRVSERRVFSFYAPKLLLVGLVGISAFTLTTWQQYVFKDYHSQV
jgi:hypothetical protein